MKDIELQAARSAFEAWMRVEHPGVDLSRRVDGSYWSSTPDSFFDGFLGGWNRRAAVEADRAQRVPDGAISGALFDFAGFLTTLDAPVRFGSTEEASPMVELLQEFAKKRGLSLDDADVMCWSARLASTPAPAQQEPTQDWASFTKAVQKYVEDYEMRGETEDGRDACYTPNENDKALLLDAFMGFDFSPWLTPSSPIKLADEFELRRLLAEERETNRQLIRALRDATEGPTFMGEPVLAAQPQEPPQQERKPMTDAVIRERARLYLQAGRSYRGLWDEGVELASRVLELGFIEGAKAAERHHGIKE